MIRNFAGRSKNVWESPMGCLMFSFTTQMEDGRVVPLVQYVVSLAITEAIKDVCDKNVSCRFVYIVLLPLKGNTDQFFQLN